MFHTTPRRLSQETTDYAWLSFRSQMHILPCKQKRVFLGSSFDLGCSLNPHALLSLSNKPRTLPPSISGLLMFLSYQGLCITCSEAPRFDGTASPTSSPTSSPSGFGFGGFFSSGDTPAPFGLFPNTLPPNAFGRGTGGGGGEIGGIGTLDPVDIREEGGEGEIGDVSTLEPIEVGEGGFGEGLTNCGCLENISETEAEVLAVRGKALVCDPTCLDGSDLIWGESHLAFQRH